MKRTYRNGELCHKTMFLTIDNFLILNKLSLKKNLFKSEIIRQLISNYLSRKHDLELIEYPSNSEQIKCSFLFETKNFYQIKEEHNLYHLLNLLIYNNENLLN